MTYVEHRGAVPLDVGAIVVTSTSVTIAAVREGRPVEAAALGSEDKGCRCGKFTTSLLARTGTFAKSLVPCWSAGLGLLRQLGGGDTMKAKGQLAMVCGTPGAQEDGQVPKVEALLVRIADVVEEQAGSRYGADLQTRSKRGASCKMGEVFLLLAPRCFGMRLGSWLWGAAREGRGQHTHTLSIQ